MQTVIRRDLVESIPHPMMQDILDYHSGVDRGRADCGPGRGEAVDVDPPGARPDPRPVSRVDRSLAAEHFDGEIIIGDDLTTVTV